MSRHGLKYVRHAADILNVPQENGQLDHRALCGKAF